MSNAVGNGTHTLCWDHKWATSEPLSKLVTEPIPIEMVGATMNEMWEEYQGWKWEVFGPYLPQ